MHSAAFAAACAALPAGAANASAVPTRWYLPQVAVQPDARPREPSVLGTVAIPIRAKPTSTRWARAMLASVDQPALARLTAGALSLAPQDQAAFVQAAVNRAIRTDRSANDCADDGYWAAASETLARGAGDCIDVALAKMEALRLLGVPQGDLYLTTGYLGIGEEHDSSRETAALLVRIGDAFWLLPEYSEHIIEAGHAGDSAAGFSPVVTYGVGVTWVHGRVVQAAMLGR